MSRYLIDVTQLVHWPGRLTGIPRVVQELAVRFETQTERDVVYVSWVKELGVMCEVDLKATLAVRGNGIEYVKNGMSGSSRTDDIEAAAAVPSPPSVPASPSLTRQGKNFAKRVARKLGVEDSAVVRSLRKNLYDKSLKDYKQITGERGDIFFIGAGEWWSNEFIRLVEAYHTNGVKIVQISHDLLPIVTPQFAGHATDSLSNYNARILPIAALVLAVSKSTKNDLTTWLRSKNLPVPAIETFRIGEDFTSAPPEKPGDTRFVQSGLKGGDFILCVGTIEARKNHALLYYAYKLAKARGETLPKLVIVGRRGYMTDDIYSFMTGDPEVKDDIVILENASDAELSWLYDHCLFTVYPSFYEGWGMPIAESIMRAAPCLASNTSSMPEIAPGFADYFTPSSSDELLDGIMKMLKPGELEKKRTHLKEYKPTYWDDSFAQVLKYLEKIAVEKV